jgi:hypothetical protein
MSSDQQGSSSIATGTQNANKLQFDKNGVQKPQTMEEIIAQQKALYPDSVDYATMYKEAQNQTGVIEKQNTVNNLTNQLNSINAETETALSRLRGVGAKEGVTEFVYGQQSAEILREGQMRASPIQARLQAAQGDLQSAQNTLDTLYKVKVQTAEQNYNKWIKIVDTSRDIFDKQQQKLINDKKAVFTNNSKRLADSVNFAQQLAVKLLETAIIEPIRNIKPAVTRSHIKAAMKSNSPTTLRLSERRWQPQLWMRAGHRLIGWLGRLPRIIISERRTGMYLRRLNRFW